jgi:hypothetical protein
MKGTLPLVLYDASEYPEKLISYQIDFIGIEE